MTGQKSRGTMGERIAVVETKLETIISQLGEIARDLATASESRKKVYEAQESVGRQIMTLDHRIQTLEREVAAFAPTSANVERLRERAIGAGTLGRWLILLGGWLVGAAAGLMQAYTWLTGRPPP